MLARASHVADCRPAIAALVLFSALRVALAGGEPSSRLTIEVDRPGVKISPTLYGIFFEEINRAGDGGLYAEMVQNRSFEDAAELVAWESLDEAASPGRLGLVRDRALDPRNPTALQLESPDGGARVGAVNRGFNGMAVRAGESYRLSMYAAASEGFTGSLHAALQSEDGSKEYARAKVGGLGVDWRQHSARLVPTATDRAARLALWMDQPGTIRLDMVSLFPANTFKQRPNGLRADLAQMLSDLKPAFVRFPGGCFVEGNKLANAFRWKDTIGDIARRPGHWNLWGYRSTDGLGYHEYLQMCEDLGATALFVINCGMAHEDHVAMDEMVPWVQDALDAIEYANGPADSKWGAVRAANGHPAPFGLTHIQIGNENGGPLYNERYALFHDAIKSRYPEIRLVANNWNGVPDSRPLEIVDEHYYRDSEFFIENAERYDTYDRKGPRIYVGEYAVTQGCGKGNLWAAIGEAAFMTGMERNADVIVMASYAPLFVNVGWRQWNPDAINFDAARAYGTPSYHVQRMFGNHRADVVLPVRIDSPKAQLRPIGGMVGVGTWDTQAEFKDIRVEDPAGKVLFQPDLMDDLSGWRIAGGDWRVGGGVLHQVSGDKPARLLAGGAWRDCTISLKARKTGGSEGFLISFRSGEHLRTWWNLGGWSNQGHGVELANGPCGERVGGRIETGRWYDIRIEVDGPSIRCLLDGRLVHDLHHATEQPVLHAVAGRIESTGDIVVKVVNVGREPQDTLVELSGLPSGTCDATVTTLASASRDDENTLDEPAKVAPVIEPARLAVPAFRRTVPGYSVTVLRLEPRAAEDRK